MLQRVSEERVMTPVLRAPRAIAGDVAALGRGINPGAKALFVAAEPAAGADPLECFENVRRKVERAGGALVVGWAIWEWPEVFVEAEHHAVWSSNQGLIDITPHGKDFDQVLFLPDPNAPYGGPTLPRRPNRRRMLTDRPEAGRFIAAVDARNDWMERLPAGVAVSVPLREARELEQLEFGVLKAQVDLLIAVANGKGRNDPCLCGSGRKFKICCRDDFN